MSLSSNSVIHFTNEISKLQSILKTGFKVKYCLETNYVKGGEISSAVPMVSFCDIPLSEIKVHISKYGSYGIGLKKEWAVKNGLNPVLYIDSNSELGGNLRLAMISLTKKTPEGRTLVQKQLLDVVRFIKNYQGDLNRNGEVFKSYRYYDEREWRYVPSLDKNLSQIVSPTAYKSAAKKEQYNNDAAKIVLPFEIADIAYIILNDESEISEFIDFLKKTFKKNPLEEVDVLVTRILTVDQIYQDF